MNARILLAGLVFGLVGCGGADPCGGSSCSNDPMPTTSDIMQCRQLYDANKNATCYREAVAYVTCVRANRVCTSGQTTDLALSTTKATNNCSTQTDAFVTCCAGNPTSTACQ